LSETVTGLRVIAVAADAAAVVEGRTIDDDFTALARWEGGVRGSIEASQISFGEGNGLAIRVYGDKAGLEWRFDNMDFLIIKYQDQPWEKWARGSTYVAEASPSAAQVTRCDKYHAEGYIEGFANIYLNFAKTVRAVIAGRKPSELDLDFPNVLDGVRGMAFIDAMLKSSANGGAWTDVAQY
ncbi:MAG: gfo/Idh/MocA family oxidoreductase, partial [Planctomycetes bacterium]|nr:gfo/Idh/MocA family oxidoreductase [Planctomycetota bacterium]